MDILNYCLEKEFKYHNLYMDIATRISKMSYAIRKQVGSVIIKDGNIIAMGWNGTPSGFDNTCEFEITEDSGEITLKTKGEVIHAEANAILKLAKSTLSAEGATLYVTLSPCVECSKMILQSGISEVFYLESYKGDLGVELLRKAGVIVNKL